LGGAQSSSAFASTAVFAPRQRPFNGWQPRASRIIEAIEDVVASLIGVSFRNFDIHDMTRHPSGPERKPTNLAAMQPQDRISRFNPG